MEVIVFFHRLSAMAALAHGLQIILIIKESQIPAMRNDMV
jgi:hypothetical protein